MLKEWRPAGTHSHVKSLRTALLLLLIPACAPAQQAPGVSTTNLTAQTVHPVDLIWFEHLGWRVQQPLSAENDVELVCRDVLRLVPGQEESVRRLLRLYEDNDAHALAGMAACYLAFLNPTNYSGLAIIQLEQARTRPAEPGSGPEWLAAQNFFDESMNRGFDCIRRQDLIGAENAFRSVLHTFPRNRPALTYLGIVNVLRGEWPMAMMVFLYASELYPEDMNFAASRARTQGYLGQAPQALTWLEERLYAHPDHPALLQTAGLIAMQCGRPAEATKYFAGWTASDGKSADAWTSYGIALTLTDQPVFARVALTKARQMDPSRNTTLLFLALNAARAQRTAEMKGHVRALIDQAGREEAARLIRATSLPLYFPSVEDFLR